MSDFVLNFALSAESLWCTWESQKTPDLNCFRRMGSWWWGQAFAWVSHGMWRLMPLVKESWLITVCAGHPLRTVPVPFYCDMCLILTLYCGLDKCLPKIYIVNAWSLGWCAWVVGPTRQWPNGIVCVLEACPWGGLWASFCYRFKNW